MRSRVVQATRERGCASIDGQQRMATRSILALAVIATPTTCRGCLGTWWAQEGLARLEGDRSGRLCDPATIEDVVPGNPAEA